jgi:hypothetical protein
MNFMKKNPKKNEKILVRALAALRNKAPDIKFKGIGLTEFSAQTDRCFGSRRRLEDLGSATNTELAVRESEDETALAMLDDIIDGVIGHVDFGDDSVLYEELGFIRKSQRKSGLTRKRKSEDKEMP